MCGRERESIRNKMSEKYLFSVFVVGICNCVNLKPKHTHIRTQKSTIKYL